MKLIRRITFSWALLILMGVVGEFTLRSLHRSRHKVLEARFPNRGQCFQLATNPDLLYVNTPNKDCGNNAQGYRDDPRTFDKPADTFRIVLIGDSVAVGDGIFDFRDRFGQVLERDLNETSPQPVEIVTLARTGYSSSQELIVLECEAFAYDPDLILWSYVLNDPAHPIYHDANGEIGKYFYTPKVHLFHFLATGLFGVKEKLADLSCPDEYHARIHCVYWPNVEALFGRLGRVADARDTPIVPIIHPVFEEGRDFANYSLTNLHEQLRALADDNQLPAIDLLDAYRPHHSDDLRQQLKVRFDPWHPNEKGHAIAADAIAQFLLDRRLFPAPPVSNLPDVPSQ